MMLMLAVAHAIIGENTKKECIMQSMEVQAPTSEPYALKS